MNVQPALRPLGRAQWLLCATLLAVAFVAPLLYVDLQAHETLQWCLDERADPGSWNLPVTRYPVGDYDPEYPPENPALHSVLSVVRDREALGNLPEERTIQLLAGWPSVRACYYLQEGPLEPLYGPGLWVVMVDVSQAFRALQAAWVAVAALAFGGLVVQRLLLKRAAEAVRAECEGIRARYVLGAHEVRAPLMAIQGCAEAIEDGLLTPGESGALVRDEVAKIHRLVEDLGKLAWVEEDREAVVMQAVDLWPYLCDEALADHWTQEAPCRRGSAVAWADAFLVDQALSSLGHWMGRCNLVPGRVAVLGPEAPGKLSRVAALDSRVTVTLTFDGSLLTAAVGDVALSLVGAIQELQGAELVLDRSAGVVELRWRPA